MNIGYWRISTSEGKQNNERQIISLKEAGCDERFIFGDEITGTSNYGDRPELSKCLTMLREGDTLVIHELDRLGRSMVEMLVQVNNLIERGVHIKTLDGRLSTKDMPEELVKFVEVIPISKAFSFIISEKFSSDPAIPSARATQASFPEAIIIPFKRSSTDTSSFTIINIDE